jgi:hypothetical protein
LACQETHFVFLGFDYYEGYKLANQATYLRDQIKWV